MKSNRVASRVISFSAALAMAASSVGSSLTPFFETDFLMRAAAETGDAKITYDSTDAPEKGPAANEAKVTMTVKKVETDTTELIDPEDPSLGYVKETKYYIYKSHDYVSDTDAEIKALADDDTEIAFNDGDEDFRCPAKLSVKVNNTDLYQDGTYTADFDGNFDADGNGKVELTIPYRDYTSEYDSTNGKAEIKTADAAVNYGDKLVAIPKLGYQVVYDGNVICVNNGDVGSGQAQFEYKGGAVTTEKVAVGVQYDGEVNDSFFENSDDKPGTVKDGDSFTLKLSRENCRLTADAFAGTEGITLSNITDTEATFTFDAGSETMPKLKFDHKKLEYKVSFSLGDKAETGTVDKEWAKLGDTVTFTLNFNGGYKNATHTPTVNGSTSDITDLGSNTYSFIMPEGKVEIGDNAAQETIKYTTVSSQYGKLTDVGYPGDEEVEDEYEGGASEFFTEHKLDNKNVTFDGAGNFVFYITLMNIGSSTEGVSRSYAVDKITVTSGSKSKYYYSESDHAAELAALAASDKITYDPETGKVTVPASALNEDITITVDYMINFSIEALIDSTSTSANKDAFTNITFTNHNGDDQTVSLLSNSTSVHSELSQDGVSKLDSQKFDINANAAKGWYIGEVYIDHVDKISLYQAAENVQETNLTYTLGQIIDALEANGGDLRQGGVTFNVKYVQRAYSVVCTPSEATEGTITANPDRVAYDGSTDITITPGEDYYLAGFSTQRVSAYATDDPAESDARAFAQQFDIADNGSYSFKREHIKSTYKVNAEFKEIENLRAKPTVSLAGGTVTDNNAAVADEYGYLVTGSGNVEVSFNATQNYNGENFNGNVKIDAVSIDDAKHFSSANVAVDGTYTDNTLWVSANENKTRTYYVRYKVTDKYIDSDENEFPYTVYIVKKLVVKFGVDNNKPEIGDITNNASSWTKEKAKLSFAVTDNKSSVESGLKTVYFSYSPLDASNKDSAAKLDVSGASGSATVSNAKLSYSNGSALSADFVLDFDLDYNGPVYFMAEDNAGNLSDVKSVEVRSDTTDPTFDDVVLPKADDAWKNGTAPTNFRVTARDLSNATESFNSGIAKVSYSYDGSSWSDSTDDGTLTFTPVAGTAQKDLLGTTLYAQEYEFAFTGNNYTGPFSILVEDNAGNKAQLDCYIKNDIIDPTLIVSKAPTEDIWSNDVSLSVTASDQVLHDSGIGKVEYKLEGDSSWYDIEDTTANTNYFTIENTRTPADTELAAEKLESKITFNGTDNFAGTVTFRVTDVAGNVVTETPVDVKSDVNKPVITDALGMPETNDDWIENGTTEFTITAEDIETPYSGIERIEYRLGEGEWKTVGTEGVLEYSVNGAAGNKSRTATVTFTGNYQGKFSVRAIDVAGNVSDIRSGYIKNDTVIPTNNADIPTSTDDWVKNGKTVITVDANDDLSGVARVEYKLGTGLWTSVSTEGVLTYTITGNVGDKNRKATLAFIGNYEGQITIRTFDCAENESVSIGGYIKNDVVKPQISGDLPQEDDAWNTNGKIGFTVTATDDFSGVKRIEYKLKTGDWKTVSTDGTVKYTVTGDVGDASREMTLDFTGFDYEGEISVRTFDLAENESETLTGYIKNDVTKPEITKNNIPQNTDDWVQNGKTEFTIDATDNLSGFLSDVGYNGTFEYSYDKSTWFTASSSTVSFVVTKDETDRTKMSVNVKFIDNYEGNFYIRATDSARNESDIIEGYIRNDIDKPVITNNNIPQSGDDWVTNGKTKFTIESTDNLAGFAKAFASSSYDDGRAIEYSTDGENWTHDASYGGYLNYSITKDRYKATATFEFTGNYEGSFYVRSVDAAGNVSDTISGYIRNDVDQPSIEGLSLDISENSNGTYRKFGSFKNSDVTITLSGIADNLSGIKDIEIRQGGTLIGGSDKSKHFDQDHVGKDSSITETFKVYLGEDYDNINIFVRDYANNEKTYSLNELLQKGNDRNRIAAENTAPYLKIDTEAPLVNEFRRDDAIWTSDPFTYVVDTNDYQGSVVSGLNSVVVNNDTVFSTGDNQTDSFRTTYYNENEGAYPITAVSVDNAMNRTEASHEIRIDRNNPEVVSFSFNPESATADATSSPVQIMDYGFYFSSSTNATIIVKDSSQSSGISQIVVYRVDENGNEVDRRYYGEDDFATNTNFVSGQENTASVVYYVPEGFKGQIYAYAIDHVNRVSDTQHPEGTILEDQARHDATSSLYISRAATGMRDIDGRELYASPQDVKFTAIDPISGIKTLTYTVSDPVSGAGTPVTINIDGDGNGTDPWSVIASDRNLRTQLENTIGVTNNANNITIDLDMTDRAGNTSHTSTNFSIDTTAPTIAVEWNKLEAKSGNGLTLYNKDRIATVTVTERNFNGVNFNILGGNASISGWKLIKEDKNNPDNNQWQATVTFHNDADYDFSITMADMAGNTASWAGEKFTIDETTPGIEVKYDNNNSMNDVYYNADRGATIIITEHNFDPKGPAVEITAKGADNITDAEAPKVSEFKEVSGEKDKWQATVDFTADGKYDLSVSYTDLAGNAAKPYDSGDFYIDKTAPAVTVTDVKNNNAYGASVAPKTDFEDYNLYSEDDVAEHTTVTIEKIDVNGEIGNDKITQTHDEYDAASEDPARYHTEYDSFTIDDEEIDGIYKMTFVTEDLAGNQNEPEVVIFSVNRFGPTYMVTNDEAIEMIKNYNDGIYTNSEVDVVVKEINVTETEGSVSVSADERDIYTLGEGTDYTRTESRGVEDETEDDEFGKGWYSYDYNILKQNFEKDAKYTIDIKSNDRNINKEFTSSTAENGRGASINFIIDKTTPDIVISGANDGELITDNTVTLNVTCSDLHLADLETVKKDLEMLEVTVNGDKVELNSDDITTNASGDILLKVKVDAKKKGETEKVKIKIKDLAGNWSDAKDDAVGAISFTLSATALQQLLNNTGLLATFIILIILIIVGIIIFIVYNRRRKQLKG